MTSGKSASHYIENAAHSYLDFVAWVCESCGVSSSPLKLQKQFLDVIFHPSDPRSAENTRLLDKLIEKYDRKFVERQMGEFMLNPEIHGQLEGTEKSRVGYFEGLHFSLPLMPYLARLVLEPNERDQAYKIYVEGVVKLAQEQGIQLDRMPCQNHLEKTAKKYLKRFEDKDKRMEQKAAKSSNNNGFLLLTNTKVAENRI